MTKNNEYPMPRGVKIMFGTLIFLFLVGVVSGIVTSVINTSQ